MTGGIRSGNLGLKFVVNLLKLEILLNDIDLELPILRFSIDAYNKTYEP